MVKQVALTPLFKKDVIDKWICEESLGRVTENIRSSSKRKGKGK